MSRTPLGAALVVAAVLCAPAPALAWTYGDTLTTLWRPLPSLPALVRPGDTLTVWANAPSSVSGFGATLRFGSLDVPLAAAGGGYVASRARWELGFRIPPGTADEVYDLVLTSDSTPPDTSRHAVRVLTAFKSDFYFAQVTDTHLPTHALSSGGSIDTADSSSMPDFDAVIQDLNLIHPEFVLHSGDLVNEGELEEYLGMYEMGRAQAMIYRLRDPLFLVSGNHDIGGWQSTLPPDGTSRKDWWRYFGWPFLGNPPAGDPYHSQDYDFDYGLLHVIGMEAYVNSGSYDHYMQNIWGAQSFTAEQMGWLAADIAAVPAGHAKLLFFHYDFGGTLANGSPGPNYSQIDPATLGLDGAIWGHYHSVPEGNRAARPFNLGLQAVVDGRRAFRIFRVSGGAIAPGPMHYSGGTATVPTDSLAIAFSGPNDGTRGRLSATVTNRFGETWDHARVIFDLADHDSTLAATGGTLAETLREGGRIHAYVDCVLPAGGVATVAVAPDAPVVGVAPAASAALRLDPPLPNPYGPGAGRVLVRFAMPAAGPVRLSVYDVGGRRIATLVEGARGPGEYTAQWDGRPEGGGRVAAGLFVLQLETAAGGRTRKLVLLP
jgi:hypothetical protein